MFRNGTWIWLTKLSLILLFVNKINHWIAKKSKMILKTIFITNWWISKTVISSTNHQLWDKCMESCKTQMITYLILLFQVSTLSIEIIFMSCLIARNLKLKWSYRRKCHEIYLSLGWAKTSLMLSTLKKDFSLTWIGLSNLHWTSLELLQMFKKLSPSLVWPTLKINWDLYRIKVFLIKLILAICGSHK